MSKKMFLFLIIGFFFAHNAFAEPVIVESMHIRATTTNSIGTCMAKDFVWNENYSVAKTLKFHQTALRNHKLCLDRIHQCLDALKKIPPHTHDEFDELKSEILRLDHALANLKGMVSFAIAVGVIFIIIILGIIAVHQDRLNKLENK